MSLNRNYRGGLDRDSGWVSVNAKAMKTGLKFSNRFTGIRDVLTVHGCLEWKRSYTTGLNSRLFRIRVPRLINGHKYRQEWITHPKTIENMCNHYNKNYQKGRKEFIEQMEWYKPNLEWAEKFYLNDDAVTYAEAQSPSRTDKLLGVISTFNSKTGRHVSTCNFAGRVHSWFGGLNKDLRPFLRVDGEEDELVCVDVKSAQPYLISNILAKPALVSELIPEFAPIIRKLTARQNDPSTKMFLRHCLEGRLYETLMDASGVNNRDKVKTMLFNHILYCSVPTRHSDKMVKSQKFRFREAFKLQYRSVYETLNMLKRTRSGTLPFVKRLSSKGVMYVTPNMMAQRLEVAIFLNRITKRLNEAGVITATIHDAWILKTSQLETFYHVFYQVFEEIGIQPPKLSIEHFYGATDIMVSENSTEK